MTVDLAKSPASLTHGTYLRLRSDLLTCVIRPGERIKINEVALRIGANPGAVREALSRLTADGLVVSESQRGFKAAPVSLKDLRDLTEARIRIETMCCKLAMESGDVEWETRIVASFHRLIRTPEYETTNNGSLVSDAWGRAHADFHFSLLASCQNEWLIRMRNLLYDQSERYRWLSIPLRVNDRTAYLDHQSAQERDHKALMEAALSRDAEAMERTIATHFTRTADLIAFLAESDDTAIVGVTRSHV